MRQNGWFEDRLRSRRLSGASAERQSRIVKMAIEHLGGAPAAMAFLNGPDAMLGGTPLAIAIRTDAGFRKVAQRISPLYEPDMPVRRYPPLPIGMMTTG